MKIIVIISALFACGLAAVVPSPDEVLNSSEADAPRPLPATEDDNGQERVARMTCTSEYQKYGQLFNPPKVHTICDPQYTIKVHGSVSAADIQIILDKHNEFRSNPRIPEKATAMCKIYWDPNIAEVAQYFANACPSGHDKLRQIPGYLLSVGQNLAWGFDSWEGAITGWFNEVQYFVHGKGSNTGNDKHVGHYTQVVKDTTCRIGCGYALCPTRADGRGGKTFVCNYATGQSNFKAPFVTGQPCESCPNKCSNNLCDCGGKMCYNRGTMDYNTCTCTCKKLYTGSQCEQPNCKPDAAHCGIPQPYGFTADLCKKYSNVPEDCPVMCNKCTANGQPGSEFTPAPTANLIAGRGQTPATPQGGLLNGPGYGQGGNNGGNNEGSSGGNQGGAACADSQYCANPAYFQVGYCTWFPNHPYFTLNDNGVIKKFTPLQLCPKACGQC